MHTIFIFINLLLLKWVFCDLDYFALKSLAQDQSNLR